MTEGKVVGGRFVRGKVLGKGSFGLIFAAVDLLTGGEVALKCESIRNRRQTVPLEGRILRELQGVPGVPRIHWIGSEEDSNVLAMDLCGPSLEELFTTGGRKMSVKTGVEVAKQMIERVEGVHGCHYLHRDVEPDNFLIGSGPLSDTIFLIDFGLSKRYRDPKTLQHVPYKEGLSLTGTARYASINAHRGMEQGRRDDLESLIYVVVYFLKGGLPWQGVDAKTKLEKYHKIMEIKVSHPVERLCASLPFEFSQLLSYTRSLKYDEKPNYAYYYRLLAQIVTREHILLDHEYDWKPQKVVKSSTMGRRKSVSQRKKKEEGEGILRSKTTQKEEEVVVDLEEEATNDNVPTSRDSRLWPQITPTTRKAIAADKTAQPPSSKPSVPSVCSLF